MQRVTALCFQSDDACAASALDTVQTRVLRCADSPQIQRKEQDDSGG